LQQNRQFRPFDLEMDQAALVLHHPFQERKLNLPKKTSR